MRKLVDRLDGEWERRRNDEEEALIGRELHQVGIDADGPSYIHTKYSGNTRGYPARRYDAAVPVLLEWLGKAESRLTRQMIATVLGTSWTGPEVAKALLEYAVAGEGTRYEGREAYVALAEMSRGALAGVRSGLVERLAAGVHDAGWLARHGHVVLALGRAGAVEAIPLFERAVETEPKMAAGVLFALRDLKDPRGLALARRYSDAEEVQLRGLARSVVRQLEGKARKTGPDELGTAQ